MERFAVMQLEKGAAMGCGLAGRVGPGHRRCERYAVKPIAVRLAQDGAAVLVTDIQDEAGAMVAAGIQEAGGQALLPAPGCH